MLSELPPLIKKSVFFLLAGLVVMTMSLFANKALFYVVTLSLGGLLVVVAVAFYLLYFVRELRE